MFPTIKSWALKLKQQARVLQAVYKDERTPVAAKVLIWITLGYLFSPVDLIPDFIPVLGLLDDFIIVPLLIALAVRLVPPAVWAGAEERVRKQPAEKWKLNPFIILLTVSAWLVCLYWGYRWMSIYFQRE